MFQKFILAGVSVLTLLPNPALAYWAINRHEVFPVSQGVFEVIRRPGSSAADLWCAAGDFARQVIATGATQRIYIWRASGPSDIKQGYSGVQFSLQPPEGVSTEPRLSLNVRVPGDNLSSASARQYCFGDDPYERLINP